MIVWIFRSYSYLIIYLKNITFIFLLLINLYLFFKCLVKQKKKTICMHSVKPHFRRIFFVLLLMQCVPVPLNSRIKRFWWAEWTDSFERSESKEWLAHGSDIASWCQRNELEARATCRNTEEPIRGTGGTNPRATCGDSSEKCTRVT